MADDTKRRAAEARQDLLKHMNHVYKIMCSARNLARDHPHAIKELQMRVGSLANASVEFRAINARLDGSAPPTEKQTVNWEDRKHVSYRGPSGWEPAMVKSFDKNKETIRIVLGRSGRSKTVSIYSGLVR